MISQSVWSWRCAGLGTRRGDRMRNLFRQEWWHHIQGLEHRWVRALNSSQCFAVNLFANLAEDRSGANRVS